MLTKKEVRDMIRWVWFLMAVGSFVGAAVLADAKTAVPVITLVTIGCFFITIAVGGKKGLPFGVGLLVFAACLFGIWYAPMLIGGSYNWPEAKKILDGLAGKPGEIVLVYLGLISLILFLIIVPPIFVGKKLWKRVTRVKRPPLPPKEKTTKVVSYRKVRGRGRPLSP